MASAPVLRALVAVVGSAPALMFVLNWPAQYLVERWGVPKAHVGGYLVFAPLLFDLGAVGFGVLASRRPLRTHADLLLVSMVLASLLALAPWAPSAGAAIALFAAAGCGGGGIYVLVTADMLGRVPLERTSSAGGMTAAAQSLAYVVASPLVGWIVDRTHGYGVALVGLGLAVVPTTLAFVAWPNVGARDERASAE